MNRGDPIGGVGAALAFPRRASAAALPGARRGVTLMDRIGPSASTLYVADRDGTGERPPLPPSALDHHATFTADGTGIVFTSERDGDGQLDVFRAGADGTAVRLLVATPSMEDAGVLSPDGSRLAFGSTCDGDRTNIWVLDVATGRQRNLTGGADVQGDSRAPTASSGRPGRRTACGSPSSATGTRTGAGTTAGTAGSSRRSSASPSTAPTAGTSDASRPYGQIFVMNSDGTDRRILTDSLWEDAMPLFVPADAI